MDGPGTVVDFSGRTYYLGADPYVTDINSPQYLMPGASDAPLALHPKLFHSTGQRILYYSDKDGVLHLYDRNKATASDAIINTGTSRFAANTLMSSITTDMNGGVWFLPAGYNLAAQKPVKVVDGSGKQIVSKAGVTTEALAFTDSTGQIWSVASDGSATKHGIDPSTTRMQPNQMPIMGNGSDGTSGGATPNIYYSNDKGHLMRIGGVDLGGYGLPAGTLYPSNGGLAIADAYGKIWATTTPGSMSGENRPAPLSNTGWTVKPGTFADSAGTWNADYCSVVMTDTDGLMHAYVKTSTTYRWWNLRNIKFTPNQMTLACEKDGYTRATAVTADGTIYRVIFDNRDTVSSPIGISLTGSSNSASGGTTIACAPTTGVVPVGLSRFGLMALTLFLAGLLLVVLRYRRRIV